MVEVLIAAGEAQAGVGNGFIDGEVEEAAAGSDFRRDDAGDIGARGFKIDARSVVNVRQITQGNRAAFKPNERRPVAGDLRTRGDVKERIFNRRSSGNIGLQIPGGERAQTIHRNSDPALERGGDRRVRLDQTQRPFNVHAAGTRAVIRPVAVATGRIEDDASDAVAGGIVKAVMVDEFQADQGTRGEQVRRIREFQLHPKGLASLGWDQVEAQICSRAGGDHGVRHPIIVGVAMNGDGHGIALAGEDDIQSPVLSARGGHKPIRVGGRQGEVGFNSVHDGTQIRGSAGGFVRGAVGVVPVKVIDVLQNQAIDNSGERP